MLAEGFQPLQLAIPVALALLNVYAIHAIPRNAAASAISQSATTTLTPTFNPTQKINGTQNSSLSGLSTQSELSLALLQSLIHEIALAETAALSVSATVPKSTVTSTANPKATSTLHSVGGSAAGSSSLSRDNNTTVSNSSLSSGAIFLVAQSLGAPLVVPTGQAISTITTIPPGISIETITSTTCSILGAMVTTTAAGSTATEVVPELCDNGFAFLLFGWTQSSSQLCKFRLSLFGFLLGCIYDSESDEKPVGIEIIEAPTTGSSGSPGDPDQDPSDQDQDPSNQDQDPRSTASTASRSDRPSGSAITYTPSRSDRSSGSTITYAPSRVTTLPSSSGVCSGSAKTSGACCTNSTVITIPSIGISTICNIVVNTLIDEMEVIGTSFPNPPSSASQLSVYPNATPMAAASVEAYFSSFAAQLFSYIDNAYLTASSMTNQIATSTSINSTCVLTSFSSTKYCTCGTVMAGPSTTILALGNTSYWCPTLAAQTSPVTSVIASPAKSKPTSSLPTSTSPSFSCTQVFFLSSSTNPNSFVCQCSDNTWNHRQAQESYSNCPNQVASTALTTLLPKATAPTKGVTCNLIIFAPGSPTWGPPFCECSQNLLFLGSCPASLYVTGTTTLTLSEPVTVSTATLPTFTTDLTAPLCTEAPSLSIKCVAPATPAVSVPSPTTSVCIPRCTKIPGLGLREGEETQTCNCNPACGGYAHPVADVDGNCPYQVAVA